MLMISGEYLPTDIGHPQQIVSLEFAELGGKHFDDGLPIVFEPLPEDDPKRRCPDITKARRILNLASKVGLDEALKLSLASFKQA